MAGGLLSTGIPFTKIPDSYVRPESQRPLLSDVPQCRSAPVVDLDAAVPSVVVTQIRRACLSHGFFQVVNHGVGEEVASGMLAAAAEFFRLPEEEKLRLRSDDPTRTVRLSTSFNVAKETVHNWRDYLRLHCHPLEHHTPDWPSNPPSFKDAVSGYCREVRALGLRLEEALSESLGLEKDHIKKATEEQGQHMAVNYYPPCPQPELTYGLPAHTDPNTLTILLQDGDVSGLQVLIDAQWLAVDPLPGAFIVLIGDQLQALSNGRYKSVRHRAVVNSERERISVASFLCPAEEAVIGPAERLTGGVDGGSAGAVYRSFTYAEYYKKFWSRNLEQEHCLELFRK